MKLNIPLPRPSLENLCKLLYPAHRGVLYLIVVLSILVYIWNAGTNGPMSKGLLILLVPSGIGFGLLGIFQRSPRQWLPYLAAGIVFLSALGSWWRIPQFDAADLGALLIIAAGALYGSGEAFSLIGIGTLINLGGHSYFGHTPATTIQAVGSRLVFQAAVAVIADSIASGQRRRISKLREELALVRSSPYGDGSASAGTKDIGLARDDREAATDLESLESSIQGILQRIKEYFRAHTVLLFQPSAEKELSLRHFVSESKSVKRAHTIDLAGSLLGRVCLRGVSSNWDLEAPESQISKEEISYYDEWQPVRHLVASPLKIGEKPAGLLLVDRVSSCPFTDLEIAHLEIFAIQILEIIEIGKRYLEQVDRNTEYRLFYTAMSNLGQSLATGEVLDTLANVCQRVVPSTYLLAALLDDSGLSYEVAYAHGMEKLRGSKVHSSGRTWISWMLNSGSKPLMLRDIRAHFSKIPVASPSEGQLAIRSVLMIPLVAKGRKLGLLLLGSSEADYYKNWHLRILSAVSQIAAANIENSLLHRRVEQEAISDGLTRLHNHRYFQERLASECSRAHRSSKRLSLLMIDIDLFKVVNDTYGHRVGDAILQQIASILKGILRSEDAIARYGGEEFVVILTESDREGALRMAERSRLAVERTIFQAEEHRIRITITIGTATYPEDAAAPMELIGQADRALYAGKSAGRNRVVQCHTVVERPSQVRGMR